MPVQYSSIVTEHTATRTSAGLFDISHMGRLRFDGPGASAFLDGLVTRRVTDLKPGGIRYALITNDAGGILDDVLVYHLTGFDSATAQPASFYLLVVNASNRQKILAWIEPRLKKAVEVQSSYVKMRDMTYAWAMIAVQGPRALELVQPLADAPLAKMRYYTGVETRVLGHLAAVSRTGYTGEDGVEIMLASTAVETLWQRLIDADATPCGLGCRDTLRLEAAMPLYGHELNEQLTPLHAGLDFAVNLEGRDFPGRDALARLSGAASLPRRVGLEFSGKRVPREGFAVSCEGRRVGEITSGTFSPTLNRPLAMAYVEPPFATVGTRLAVDVRGRDEPAIVVPLPFYRRATQA
jgi:aminomethyltransferase